MTKKLALALAAVLGAALMAATTGHAATIRTFEGHFLESGPDTSIQIRTRFEHGEAVAVKSVRFRGLPAECEVSMKDAIRGAWKLGGAKVNDERRFRVRGNDGNEAHPSSVRLRGRFNRKFTRVRGRFQSTLYFSPDDPPEETCVGKTRRYVASR